MENLLRVTHIITSNTRSSCSFPGCPLAASLLLHLTPHLPVTVLLADPPGNHGSLAVCHAGVGEKDSIACTLVYSHPLLP